MPQNKPVSPDAKPPPKKLGRGIGSLISVASPIEVSAWPRKETSQDEATRQASAAPTAIASPDVDAVRFLAPTQIAPSPFQPRRVMNEASIIQLAESIRHSGVMQPIIVRPSKSGGGVVSFELVAGERRWRAAKMAGLETIPSIVRVLSDEQTAEWALVENVQREDLNPIERGLALKDLSLRFGISHSDLAKRIGLERSTVANLIRLTELEPEIADMISRGELTGGHGKALLAIPPGEARLNLAREAVTNNWNVRKVEFLAQAHAVKPENVGTKSPKEEVSARQAVLRDLERQIGQHLGTKVLITTDRTGTRGKLSIEFYTIDHFDGLLSRLGIPTQ